MNDEQEMELEALESIYDDNYELLSTEPPQISIIVSPCDDEEENHGEFKN